MLPRFYYIHQPAGSPQDLNLRYRGIDRTGQLPESVDFALTKIVEPQKFDVIVFADPQPESALEVDFIRDDVVNALIGSSAAFGVTIGDIMYDDLSLYPRLNAGNIQANLRTTLLCVRIRRCPVFDAR